MTHEDRAWCLEVYTQAGACLHPSWYRLNKALDLIGAIRSGVNYVTEMERRYAKINLRMRLFNTAMKEEIPWDIL